MESINKISRNIITTRQFMLMFLMMAISFIIRMPRWVAEIGRQAAWLSPILVLALFMGLMLLMRHLFARMPKLNLFDVMSRILSRPVAVIVSSIFLIWLYLLAAFYVRHYAERISAYIFPNTPVEFPIVIMIVLIWIMLRSGIVTLARFLELSSYIMTGLFFITTLLAIMGSAHMENLLPVSYLDIGPVAKVSVMEFAAWAVVTPMFFLYDRVDHRNDLIKRALRSGSIAAIMLLMVLVVTIGTLGYSAAVKISLPYYTVVKNASVYNTMEHFEAVIIVIWIVADFAISGVLAMSIASVQKSIFSLQSKKTFITPTALILLALSLLLTNTSAQLNEFSAAIAVPINLILFVGTPVLLFVVGKIRKII